MTRCVAAYLGAALMVAWAILRTWDHFRRRPAPASEWQEPDDGVQPPDERPWRLIVVSDPLHSITSADGRGTFSRN